MGNYSLNLLTQYKKIEEIHNTEKHKISISAIPDI